jgi:hypothetical protein
MNTSTGPISAESIPPAPNSDQNMGALERFMASSPARQETAQGTGPPKRQRLFR